MALSEGGDIPHEITEDYPLYEMESSESDSDDSTSSSDEEEDDLVYFTRLGLPFCGYNDHGEIITKWKGKSAVALVQPYKGATPNIVMTLKYLSTMDGVQRLYTWRYLAPGIHYPYKHVIVLSDHDVEMPQEVKYYSRRLIQVVRNLHKRHVVHGNISVHTVSCDDKLVLTDFSHASVDDDNNVEDKQNVAITIMCWILSVQDIDDAEESMKLLTDHELSEVVIGLFTNTMSFKDALRHKSLTSR